MSVLPPVLSRTSRGVLPRRLPAATVAAVALLLAASPGARAQVEPPGVWPLRPQPEVVAGFDPPEVRWAAGHRGVDLAGHVGQPVRAALAGTVGFAGTVAGRGVVVVDHGATRTTYEPVTAAVSRGDVVRRGQVLGSLAWFGTHCLPAACLHWGLRDGDTYLDPLQLVGGPLPVRLLPLTGSPVLRAPAVPRSPVSRTPAGPPTQARAAVPVPALPPPALVAVAGAAVGAGPPGPVRPAGAPGGTPTAAARH